MIGQRFAHAEEETLFRAYAELHILAIVHQREEALRLARRFCLANGKGGGGKSELELDLEVESMDWRMESGDWRVVSECDVWRV